MYLKIIFSCLLVLIVFVGCYSIESRPTVTTSQQINDNLISNSGTNTSIDQQDTNTSETSNIVEKIPDNHPKSEDKEVIDSSENLSTDKYIYATKYNGKWISTNYEIIQMDGYTSGFGSELYLMFKSDGIIEMKLYDISSPPASMIASIEMDVKISPEGLGTFTSNNDGWGSHGNGSIELLENKVIINIDSQIEKDSSPDWKINSGQKVFVREKIQSDGAKNVFTTN